MRYKQDMEELAMYKGGNIYKKIIIIMITWLEWQWLKKRKKNIKKEEFTGDKI